MESKRYNNSHFSSGFLLGIIVGASLVFFLFTKKGRELINRISEEGLEGILDLEDLLEDKEEVAAPVKTSNSGKRAQKATPGSGSGQARMTEREEATMPIVAAQHIHADKAPEEKEVAQVHHVAKSAARRLFKGIPKRH